VPPDSGNSAYRTQSLDLLKLLSDKDPSTFACRFSARNVLRTGIVAAIEDLYKLVAHRETSGTLWEWDVFSSGNALDIRGINKERSS